MKNEKRTTNAQQSSTFNVKVWYRCGNVIDEKAKDPVYSAVKRDGTAVVYLVVHVKRKMCVFNTGVSVKPTDWDADTLRVKKSNPVAGDLNLIIDNCRAKLNDIFVKYRLQHEELTPQLIKKEYEIPTSYINFYAWFDRTFETRKDELEKRTLHHHKAIIGKLKKWKPNLSFSEIDSEFIASYKIHLQKKYKNAPATIYTNLAKIRAYLNIAKKQGVIRKNPFDDFKLKNVNTDREFLIEEELNRLIALYEVNYLPPLEQRVLRLFLFSCLTSLRISDLRLLTFEMILNDIIVYVPKKTAKTKFMAVRIPLQKYAKKLITDESRVRLHGKVFDMPPDSKINKSLKEIIKVKGYRVEKDISFHTSRHTFATIFLRRTKNIVMLQKLLGHSDIKTTMIYAHLISEDVIEEMKCWDEVVQVKPAQVKSLQK